MQNVKGCDIKKEAVLLIFFMPTNERKIYIYDHKKKKKGKMNKSHATHILSFA